VFVSCVNIGQSTRRKQLTYNVKVYCDAFYYGEYCDTFCKAADDEFGHYTCDTTTGSFICDEGKYNIVKTQIV
jgi:jagged-like protein